MLNKITVMEKIVHRHKSQECTTGLSRIRFLTHTHTHTHTHIYIWMQRITKRINFFCGVAKLSGGSLIPADSHLHTRRRENMKFTYIKSLHEPVYVTTFGTQNDKFSFTQSPYVSVSKGGLTYALKWLTTDWTDQDSICSKGRVYPLHHEVQIRPTLALDGAETLTSCSRRVTSGEERPCIHWMGEWVSPNTSERDRKDTNLVSTENRMLGVDHAITLFTVWTTLLWGTPSHM
jgi:hypothetical protein